MSADAATTSKTQADAVVAATTVSFREALKVWCRVAALSFGGPAGQIAVMHRILVEEKRWISEERFLHALNYCMLLPGPEAQQLATYIGWLLHRTLGGLVAGSLFVLPGFLSILALSVLYGVYQDTSFVQALFYGLKPAVIAIVVEAVFRIGRRALKNRTMVAISVATFVGMFFFAVPFPLMIVTAALIGLIGGRFWPGQFHVIKEHRAAAARPGDSAASHAVDAAEALHARPSLARSLKVLAICLTLWLAPLVLLAATLGPRHVLTQEGFFFSKVSIVTFGGAYSVLAYVGQQAVENFHWVQPREMLDGLGMAETTPGPLIQVLQFVGFMGAYRNPAPFSPLTASLLASLLTTWVTFVPCFLWIFLGAPYIERLRGIRSLSCALSTITAAVVGVVLNLAVWFSLHTLFADVAEREMLGMRLLVPQWSTLDLAAALIALGAFAALFYFKRDMLTTLAAAAAVGMIVYYLR
jgi:chromate transporter